MKTVIKGEINRKIHGDKLIAADMLKVLPAVENVINTFNGKKCFKVDGSKMKAFNDAMDQALTLNGERLKRVYYNTQYSSLYMKFSYGITWESFPNDNYKSDDFSYVENDFYFGKKSDDGVLTMNEGWAENVRSKCEELLAVDPSGIAARLREVKELVKQAKEINDNIPYYARLTLPYVG